MIIDKIMNNIFNVSGSESENLIKENKKLVIINVRIKSEYNQGYFGGCKLMLYGLNFFISISR